MMFLCRYFAFFLIMFSAATLSAQQFGGNPPSLKWKQVNTDTVRVIFPTGLDKEAREVAALVHHISATTLPTIGDKLRKINIVLQNQTTEANGYVSLGPFRSEFFLTPKQNSFELGSLPWHKTLALHEYRHVQQFNNFRKGLSRAFYFLFGEEGQALANSLAIPDWFWEGDAVYQETLLSRQGRGRIPFFFNEYRSLWASDKNYSWMKLRNGSYRDLVPDHYRLGYMLVAYGREKYGDSVWREVTGNSAAFNKPFYPFQHAVKKFTGKSFIDFRNEAIDYFRTASGLPATPDSIAVLSKKTKHFNADYEFPQWNDSASLVYVKSSYKKIASFYQLNIHSGKEKKIRVKDISSDNYFSMSNGKMVYSSYHNSGRWGWKNYQNIQLVDLASGKQQTITRKTKYFSPDISADGRQVVAVHMDPLGKSELHLIDVQTGKILAAIPNTNNWIYTYPKFHRDGIVCAVRNTTGEMALGIFNVVSGIPIWITPFSTNVIGFPQINKDTIYFTMTENGRDKLFAAADHNLYRFLSPVDNHSTGSYQLSGYNGKYSWTEFTSAGYLLLHGTGRFEPAYPGKKKSGYPLQAVLENYITDSIIVKPDISKYPKSTGLFHVHSWRPYISDPEYSYSLVSQNILNTLQSELFITYNRNEKFTQGGASVAYAGWFPVITGGGSYTFDRSYRDTASVIHWNEFNANAGISIPLSFNHGAYTQYFNFRSGLNTQQVFYKGTSKNMYADKRFNYGELSLSATNQRQKARQQIYPAFAQTIFTRYRSILNRYTAHQFLASGSIYLPGLFNNHSIVLQAAYQQRDTLQQYNFSSSFPFSRGYEEINFPRIWKLGINYHFPIVYPEVGFGNIFYLLRIRGNVFYDQSAGKSSRTKKIFDFRTAGGEVYFDSKWWNQLPVSFGFRYSRLLDSDLTGRSPNQWEFVLPVNLLSR